MDDNRDNFRADIIASGTIATFTEEECSQADMYLNIPPNEDTVASVMDTTANSDDNSRNNEESVVNESIECSHEVYIYNMYAVAGHRITNSMARSDPRVRHTHLWPDQTRASAINTRLYRLGGSASIASRSALPQNIMPCPMRHRRGSQSRIQALAS
jgi:hypothetical protein